jgi:hypothetical protein
LRLDRNAPAGASQLLPCNVDLEITKTEIQSNPRLLGSRRCAGAQCPQW